MSQAKALDYIRNKRKEERDKQKEKGRERGKKEGREGRTRREGGKEGN